MERSANGSAGFDADNGAQASERITDARIHCVISSAGQHVAVCDNGTLISMKRGAHGKPAHLVHTAYTPPGAKALAVVTAESFVDPSPRSEEHTSELQSLMRISYAVFCLKKKKKSEHKPHIST